MTVTKFSGGIAAGGGSSRATVASGVYALRGSFSATSATQVAIGTLPAGARVTDVISYGGATGGTNPTVDVGTVGDDDGFGAELDADAKSSAVAAGTSGVLLNTLLTANTVVYGKVGASAATGGTTTVLVFYTIEDL
jgi:hypothetical protein